MDGESPHQDVPAEYKQLLSEHCSKTTASEAADKQVADIQAKIAKMAKQLGTRKKHAAESEDRPSNSPANGNTQTRFSSV